jgi:hypothetical protein
VNLDANSPGDDMDETKQQSLTDEQAKAIAEMARLKAEMIHRAYRSHTRRLFWLWLLLVLAFSWIGFAVLWREAESAPSVTAFAVTFWLILITGGYVFQEVRNLHRRIDGLLRLIDSK